MAKQTQSRATKSSKKKKKSNVLSQQSQAIILAVVVLLFGVIGVTYLRGSNAASSYNIDVSHQSDVNTAYWTGYGNNVNLTSGWTGSTTGCHPGDISDQARNAMRSEVNLARRLNQLAIIGNGDTTANNNTQRTALMMDANNDLSHYPPSNWLCYATNGANTAAKSDLSRIADSLPNYKPAQAIRDFLDDPGNPGVGHRRWLLLPEATVFGFGMTGHAAAVQVVGLATNTNNPNPSWVSWPTHGWFPAPLAPPVYWSLSSGSTKLTFKYAYLKVTHNGSPVSVTKQPIVSNEGRPTLAWTMPTDYAKTGTYVVTVTNVKSTVTTKTYSRQYTINFFAPSK